MHPLHSSMSLKCRQIEVIMIPKPGKQLKVVTLCRPISLLPDIQTVQESPVEETETFCRKKCIISLHKFGFRNKHGAIDQVHRITNLIG